MAKSYIDYLEDAVQRGIMTKAEKLDSVRASHSQVGVLKGRHRAFKSHGLGNIYDENSNFIRGK